MSLELRLLRLLGALSFWKVTGRLHTWLYQLTGGRIGHSAGNLTNLLLTTTGRRSGAPRTVALAYVAEGPRYVLVASNGGSDDHPAWWLNLRAMPRATVQIGERAIAVVAHEADGEERTRLWAMVKGVNPFYGRYERMTARRIPVVVLEPAGP